MNRAAGGGLNMDCADSRSPDYAGVRMARALNPVRGDMPISTQALSLNVFPADRRYLIPHPHPPPGPRARVWAALEVQTATRINGRP